LAFRSGLAHVLQRLDRKPGDDHDWFSNEVNQLADGWFTQAASKKKVAQWLEKYGLDISVVEAEAIRLSAPTLKYLDAVLASAEARRSKALAVAERRKYLAQRLRQSSDHLITTEPAALEHKASDSPPELA
jgi:hypothetical protein